MKVIKVESCDKCPYGRRAGFNTITGIASYGCINAHPLMKCEGGSVYDCKNDHYNHTVWEGEIAKDCPLEDI